MPGDGKTSRCGWEVLTSGRRRDEREDEGAGRRERGLIDSHVQNGRRERGREAGWERRERGRVGVLSWLNLMSGGDISPLFCTCPPVHRWSRWQQFQWIFLDNVCSWQKFEQA